MMNQVTHHHEGFLDWLSHHLLTCPFKSITGLDCPGCGFQRSIIALLKGDFTQAFKLYPASIPIIALFIFTLNHLYFDFKSGAKIIKIMYMSIALIVVVSYIYKIYNHQLQS